MDAFDLLPKLIRSSLESDKKAIEAISLMIVRKIKKDHPETAAEISKALAYSGFENVVARSLDLSPLPVDRETRFSLLKVEEPVEIQEPILDEYIKKQLDDFIGERKMINIFLQEGITPTNSILFDGPPGVGKTYIAHWLSFKLGLPLASIDLASSISSYLGRSGQNIRSIFDYVRARSSILFLDELDAIAKRRDDSSDLGELKRLVNVLLTELETCPSTCIIVGATNHPELLDKAIWRRFDRTLTIPLPAEEQRRNLLLRHLGKLSDQLGEEVISYLAINTDKISAAEICKLCDHIKRQVLLNPEEPKVIIALAELFKISRLNNRDEKVRICKKLKSEFPQLSQRDISQITHIPLTSVSRYLLKGKGD